jgi:outer membrane biosynthesis protein TonB
MLPSSCGDATIWVEPQPTRRERTERIGPGLIYSLVLHGLVALLVILGLPSVLRAPELEQVMPVGLVQLGAGTAALPRQDAGDAAPEVAREAPRSAPADPEPAAPAAAAPPEPEPLRQPDKPTVVTPRNKPEPSKSKAGPRLDPLATVTSPDQPPPPRNDLDARLKALARQQQQQAQAQAPANRRLQNDPGSSSLTATGNGTAGGSASYNVKDFIRAQIERHWRLDASAQGADFAIAIHVTLNRDGSVKSADIVADPRYRSSTAYHALALSARNAVLLSSPLDLPPGRYDEVADVTLNFNPRTALQ